MNQVLPRQRRPDAGLLPAGDVRLVLVLHADRLAVERRVAGAAEMKDELVAVVEKPLAVDRLVVADGEVVGQPGPRTGQRLFDRDRLDPVDGVLQLEVRPRPPGPRRAPSTGPSAWRRRSGTASRPSAAPAAPPDPLARPLQILRSRPAIVVGPVPDAEVVRRRGDDGVDRAGAEGVQDVDGVAVEEPQPGPAALEFGVRFGSARGTARDCTALTPPYQCQGQ